MQAKRFIAADMRRALDMVKEEFGEEAMIVSTERTSRGVEIVASLETSMQSMRDQGDLSQQAVSPHQQNIANAASRFTSPVMESTPLASASTNTAFTSQAQTQAQTGIGLASGKTKEELAAEMELANQRMLASKKAESMTLGQWANQPEPVAKPSLVQEHTQSHTPISTAKENEQSQEIKRLQDEIVAMRDMLEVQLSQMAETQERQYIESIANSATPGQPLEKGNLPVIGEIKYQLDLMGLPQACNDHLVASIKNNPLASYDKHRLWTHVLANLSKNIPSTISDPVSKGGVYSFLGMTGVGKTTTIAKLAARYVMEHGSEGVMLLTTDNYRIAAHNQLQSLAKILNVSVRVVDDLAQLPQAISEASNYPLVLIDTPGMGHNDPLLKPHLQHFKHAKTVKNILVLSANSQYQMIKASLHSYRQAGLDYCILTKLDECAHLGDAMGVLYKQTIPLAYITDGQSVPKDIDVMKSTGLVSKAVAMLKRQRKLQSLNKHLEQQSI